AQVLALAGRPRARAGATDRGRAAGAGGAPPDRADEKKRAVLGGRLESRPTCSEAKPSGQRTRQPRAPAARAASGTGPDDLVADRVVLARGLLAHADLVLPVPPQRPRLGTGNPRASPRGRRHDAGP